MKGGSGRKVEIMEVKKEEMRKGMTEEKKVRLVKTRVKDTTKRGGGQIWKTGDERERKWNYK